MQRNRFSAFLIDHLLMENLNIYTIKSLLHAREGNLSFARQMSEADLRKLKTGLVPG